MAAFRVALAVLKRPKLGRVAAWQVDAGRIIILVVHLEDHVEVGNTSKCVSDTRLRPHVPSHEDYGRHSPASMGWALHY